MAIKISFRKSVNDVHAHNEQRRKLRRRRPTPMAVVVPYGNGADHHPDSLHSTGALTLPDHDSERHSDRTDSDSGSQTVAPSSTKSKFSDSPSITMDDPQQMVIMSLRSQISDLISQVTQLNGKLVKSYDRVSDLEDELHVASSNLRNQSVKVSQLELERTQHLAALDTGLLVEKAHVTSELTRLMEKATEEAAFRGEAENARANIEQDLDDLSATLFNQANTMVAEARFDKSLSEKKAADAEMALKTAEEVVSSLQQQMQLLRDERDRGSEEVDRMRVLMEKGKFVAPQQPSLSSSTTRLLSSHSPFQEFILFIAHLRSLRQTTPQPPTISTFLTLPFLARIVTEDSDPTVRLDFAPSLNWLSRRSVLSAIQTGQLTVEPMSTNAFLMEGSTTSLQAIIPGSHTGVNCALCGTPVIRSPSESTTSLPQALARQGSNLMHSGTWSSSFFKNPLSSAAPSPPLTPPPQQTHHLAAPPRSPTHPQHIYVFRVTHLSNANSSQQQQKPTNYPLCSGGWCLTRLRTTCSLWTFIRISVIDHVWEEAALPPVPPPIHPSLNGTSSVHGQDRVSPMKEKAPPLPPRRRSKIPSVGSSMGSLGSFWGALRSGQQSQSQTPSKRNSIESQDGVVGAVPMVRTITMDTTSSSSSSVPPPLPRRSTDRAPNDHKLLAPAMSRDNVSLASEYSHTLNEENYPMPLTSKVSTTTTNYMTPSNSQYSESHSDDGPSDLSDEFKTPVDELQSYPISRVASASNDAAGLPLPKSPPPRDPLPDPPLSPRSVPLPDSRPGSPAAKSRPSSMQVMVNHTLQLPTSRAASPSPGGATAGNAPPPPLPRRAAARRPVPQAPGSRANSPKGEKAVESTTAGSSNENSPQEEKAVLPAMDSAEDSPIAEEPEVFTDADEAASITTVGDSPVDAKEEETDVTPVEPKPDADAVKHEKKEVAMKEEKYIPPPPPRRRVGLPAANGVSSSDRGSEKEKNNQSHEDGDSNSYVGDATWEERTWKEITRLREDMFWARIGGVRN